MKKRRSKKPLLAYGVTEDSENTGGVVYAKSPEAARVLAASDFGGGVTEGYEVVRVPWADRFSPGPCPHWIMVENGWWFEGVHGLINADEMNEAGLPIDGIIGAGNSMTFRNAAERDEYRQEQDEKARFGESVLAALRLELLRRLPKAKPLLMSQNRWNGRRHAYVIRRDGALVCQEAVLPFDFDGAQIGCGTIAFRDFVGVENATVSICYGDVPVFNEWAKSQGYGGPFFDQHLG